MRFNKKFLKFHPLGAAGHKKNKRRPARISAEKPSDPNHLVFWRGMGQELNDNGYAQKTSSKNYILVISMLALAAAVALSLNFSVISAQIAMHGHGAILSHAMDANPDMVAFMMNEISVGE